MAELAEGFDGRDAERSSIEAGLQSKILKFLAAQKKRILEVVEAGGQGRLGGEFWQQEQEALGRELLAEALRYTNELGQMAADDMQEAFAVGADWSLVNADAMSWAREFVGSQIKGITATTRTAVQQAVAAWIESGEELPALAKALEAGGQFDARRARLIAATEVTEAYSKANDLVWGSLGKGVVADWAWATAADERVCPICGELDGQEFEIGKGPAQPAHPG